MFDPIDLRRQAQQRLMSQHNKPLRFLPQTTSELVEELQILQEELLIQNEALEQAQAQLEASRQEYIDLFEFAPVGYFILDQAGQILSANLTGAGQLNVPRQKLLKRNFAEYIAPASQDAFHLHCQQLHQFGARQTCELQLLKANDSVFETRLEMILNGSKEGELQLRIAVTDVTGQKQLERTYQTLVEQSLQGLAIFQDGRIVFANSALARLCGYPVEEILAFSPGRFNQLVHPRDQSAFQQHLALCLASKTTDPQLEFRLVRLDGQVCWIELYANSIEYRGRPALKLVYRDISRRKQVEAENEELLEALTQQNTRLRELSARLTEVQETERQRLARALHDQVGQSLTALAFRLNFLKMQVEESGAAEPLQEHLAEALALLDQGTDSIRRVNAELRPPMLDEQGLAEALRWHAEKVADWARVTINLEADELNPRPPLLVENHLFRIAQEAVNNAIKHSGATEIAISIQAKKHLIRMMVADNGCGFKAPASTQLEQQQGSSGLLNMHERAEMIDGLCRIESSPGHGTRVVVEVPRQ